MPDLLDEPAVAVGIVKRHERLVVAASGTQTGRLPLWSEVEGLADVHAADRGPVVVLAVRMHMAF